MENLISWIIALYGIPLCWVAFLRVYAKRNSTKLFLAIGFSLVLTILLIAASIYANSYCIEALGMCSDLGDMNMSYWFNNLYVFPIYVVVAYLGISRRS